MKKDLIWLIVGILFAAFYTGGVVLLGYEWGHSGVVELQTTLTNERKAAQTAAQQAKLIADSKYASLEGQFKELTINYQKATSEKVPTVADSIPASLAAGNLRLRDSDACPTANPSKATANSRSADAAATQALADRVQDSINAVRAGDEADARERQLDAQIIGLQQALEAERQSQGSKPDGKH